MNRSNGKELLIVATILAMLGMMLVLVEPSPEKVLAKLVILYVTFMIIAALLIAYFLWGSRD